MIEWKRYGETRDTQPPSHEPMLVTNGEDFKVCIHQHDNEYGGYAWFSGVIRIKGVTHYAEINLPMAGDSHE